MTAPFQPDESPEEITCPQGRSTYVARQPSLRIRPFYPITAQSHQRATTSDRWRGTTALGPLFSVGWPDWTGEFRLNTASRSFRFVTPPFRSDRSRRGKRARRQTQVKQMRRRDALTVELAPKATRDHCLQRRSKDTDQFQIWASSSNRTAFATASSERSVMQFCNEVIVLAEIVINCSL
jgi:hypothetical protein